MAQIVVIFESTEVTQQNFDTILAEMGDQEKAQYPHRPVHLAFQKPGSFCVIDVWNSPEELNDFAQNTLGPVFAKLGITPPEPQVYPLYRYTNTGGM